MSWLKNKCWLSSKTSTSFEIRQTRRRYSPQITAGGFTFSCEWQHKPQAFGSILHFGLKKIRTSPTCFHCRLNPFSLSRSRCTLKWLAEISKADDNEGIKLMTRWKHKHWDDETGDLWVFVHPMVFDPTHDLFMLFQCLFSSPVFVLTTKIINQSGRPPFGRLWSRLKLWNWWLKQDVITWHEDINSLLKLSFSKLNDKHAKVQTVFLEVTHIYVFNSSFLIFSALYGNSKEHINLLCSLCFSNPTPTLS